MGGCRCNFRDCENSTTTAKGMHFFHFPVRDMERCKLWAANAQRESFLRLPFDKLKNKVVCEDHFKLHMFMNYMKERLIRTAIPHVVTMKDGTLWDLEFDQPFQREPLPTSPPKKVLKREVSEFKYHDTALMENVEELESEDGQIEVIDVHYENTEIEFMDTSNLPNFIEVTNLEKLKTKKSTSAPTSSNIRVLNTSYKSPIRQADEENIKIPKIMNVTSQGPPPGVKIKKMNGFPRYLQKVSMKPKIQTVKTEIALQATPIVVVEPEQEPEPEIVASSTDVPCSSHQDADNKDKMNENAVYINKLNENAKQIDELKKLLLESIEAKKERPTTPRPKQEKQPNMNKVQLFTGIKRYLNPSMVALLRMEMFSAPERQWKPDEKSFAVELLNLGDNVYDYMCDEYRFRLPAKKDVQKWKQENNYEDMDDV